MVLDRSSAMSFGWGERGERTFVLIFEFYVEHYSEFLLTTAPCCHGLLVFLVRSGLPTTASGLIRHENVSASAICACGELLCQV